MEWSQSFCLISWYHTLSEMSTLCLLAIGIPPVRMGLKTVLHCYKIFNCNDEFVGRKDWCICLIHFWSTETENEKYHQAVIHGTTFLAQFNLCQATANPITGFQMCTDRFTSRSIFTTASDVHDDYVARGGYRRRGWVTASHRIMRDAKFYLSLHEMPAFGSKVQLVVSVMAAL